jgi:hypothetical protein
LYVDQGVFDAWLTCPRCLTQVMNPNQAVQAAPTATPANVPPRADTPTCAECGEAVDPRWTYCPYCNESLRRRSPQRAAERAAVDAEVKWDSRGAAVALGIFGLLVLCAGAAFLGTGGGQLLSASGEGLVGVVVLVVLVGGFAALMAGSPSAGTKALSGVMLGCSVALLILLCAVFAFVASVLETCSKCGRP